MSCSLHYDDPSKMLARADRLIAAVHESAFGTKRTFHDRVPMSAFGGKADIQRIQSMPSFRACQTSTLRLDADAVFRWADTRPRIAEQAAGRGSLVARPQAA